jgi:hypothetical protein
MLLYVYAVGSLWCAGVAAFLFTILMKSIISDFGKEPFLTLAFYAVLLCVPFLFMAFYFFATAAILIFW